MTEENPTQIDRNKSDGNVGFSWNFHDLQCLNIQLPGVLLPFRGYQVSVK
jgi:hypothetical protein